MTAALVPSYRLHAPGSACVSESPQGMRLSLQKAVSIVGLGREAWS